MHMQPTGLKNIQAKNLTKRQRADMEGSSVSKSTNDQGQIKEKKPEQMLFGQLSPRSKTIRTARAEFETKQKYIDKAIQQNLAIIKQG